MLEGHPTKNTHTKISIEEEDIDVMEDKAPHAVQCHAVSGANNSVLEKKLQPLNCHHEPITGQDKSLFYQRSISESSDSIISVTGDSPHCSVVAREESDESGFDSPHCSPLGTDNVLDTCSSDGSVASDEFPDSNVMKCREEAQYNSQRYDQKKTEKENTYLMASDSEMLEENSYRENYSESGSEGRMLKIQSCSTKTQPSNFTHLSTLEYSVLKQNQVCFEFFV